MCMVQEVHLNEIYNLDATSHVEVSFETARVNGRYRRQLLDAGLMKAAGWQAPARLEDGLRVAYAE